MKLVIYSLLILFNLGISGFAQVPNWLWARSAGGAGADYGNSLAIDYSGNIYITGSYSSSAVNFGTTTLTNAGDQDIYITKYDGNGNVIWARSVGGSASDGSMAIATDANGSVYVTGYFGSNSISFGTITLTHSGDADIFIAKYDSSGNVLWAKSAGGINDDRGYSISTDASGNVYVTGFFFSASVTFGAVTLNNVGAVGITQDVFITKYDASGNVIWAKRFGGADYDIGNSISTDASGHVYLSGTFSYSPVSFGVVTLIPVGLADIFIAKLDSSGNVLWAKSAGGTSMDFPSSIATDAVGNVYITGQFNSDTLTFGSTSLTTTVIGIGIYNYDMFIAKYDNSGNVLWAQDAGELSDEKGINISTDASGNVYVTGSFGSDSVMFGSSTLYNSGTGSFDMFITKYDGSGNVLWAKHAGGTDYENGNRILADAGGNVYVTGNFSSSTVAFDSTVLTNSGNADLFLAKLDVLTSLEDVTFNETIHAFPNPFSTSARLNFKERVSQAKIVFTNLLGQPVREIGPVSGQSAIIDRGNLPEGMYCFTVWDGKSRLASGRIVVADH